LPTNSPKLNSFELNPPSIHIDGTLGQALNLMQNASERTLFVVGKENKLIGVLTEGDLMRAFASNQLPHSSVSSFLNSSPIFSYENLTEVELINLFVTTGLLLLPIVDNKGCIIGAQSVRIATSNLMNSILPKI
jgi:arabinose-5-phosphate isomerase